MTLDLFLRAFTWGAGLTLGIAFAAVAIGLLVVAVELALDRFDSDGGFRRRLLRLFVAEEPNPPLTPDRLRDLGFEEFPRP